MNSVVVLADDGTCNSAVIKALARQTSADVVTMTVDIGQSRHVHVVRDAALSAGAVRAHIVDAVEEFVRECVLPTLLCRRDVMAGHSSTTVAYPIIAAHLVDIARREQTRLVAHGGNSSLTAAITALDPSLQVLTVEPVDRTAPTTVAPSCHLLQRPVADPAIARGLPANLEIGFDASVPVSINGVSLALAELMESLSLIGGQHGIGHAESADAPGVLVLATAYRALDQGTGVVRIELLDGRQRVVSTDSRTPALVNHA
jgi:argininosuccinate synthase